MASSKEFFTGNDKGSTIEEFIEYQKSRCKFFWVSHLLFNLKDEAAKWWDSLDDSVVQLPHEKLEKLLLEKWSQARKQDKEKHVGSFLTGIFLLQVHGLIQKEKIILSINPSCKQNLINVNLARKLQVLAKHIEKTQDVQVYKYLKLSMDKCVLHGDFYTSDMDNMDVFFGYPWMESVGNININV